jgi:hypothetical protein
MGTPPTAVDIEQQWFAAGKFEEMVAAAGAAVRLLDAPEFQFAYGRALVLGEEAAEGAVWFRRAASRCPDEPRYALAVSCLDAGSELDACIAQAEAAGASQADWLAMAVLLAEGRRIEPALAIVERHLTGGAVPCRILRLLALWTDQSPQVAAMMLRLAWSLPISMHLPVGQNRAEMVLVLRRLAACGEFAIIVDLARAMIDQLYEEFSDALWQIMADWRDQALFRQVPVIGPAVAEMRLARMRRRLALLLGEGSGLVADEMPRFVELVPVSAAARQDWEATVGRKGPG